MTRRNQTGRTKSAALKKTEADDIVTYLIPELEEAGIDVKYLRIDQGTTNTGAKRGDIWISRSPKTGKYFERDIVALIEAKHRSATLSSMAWRDAMAHGRLKAAAQGLTFYGVTNCNGTHRFYNVEDDSEIVLDGDVLTRFVSLPLLSKIGLEVSPQNSFVVDQAAMIRRPVSEVEFRTMLGRLANVYRSAGITQGDDRIDPTVGFVVLKYISEKEKEHRTLPSQIPLWESFNSVIENKGDLKHAFRQTRDMLWGRDSEYRDNAYKDFKDLVTLPPKLLAEHYVSIYKDLSPLDLHGASFDVFGSIYEAFASQTKKKEFGEFYTRRHITNTVARLLLRDERRVRDLRIADPACGTGGFLTEAFKAIRDGLKKAGKLTEDAMQRLYGDVFWGFDSDSLSVARTKLNMFLAGDGHMHVYERDSITDWGDHLWRTDQYDYVLTNPPMGRYQGSEPISSFEFTNERRMELLFTERVIKATKPGGEIAIVLNDGSLEAPSRADFRRKLLLYCDVRAVVSLTKFAFAPYTKEKTYVVFLRRKLELEHGKIQKTPIWHYIVDYDGFANSDKRYKTKYHDDLPELSDVFPNAMEIINTYDEQTFPEQALRATRSVNDQEKSEGLQGKKFGFVSINEVNESNYFNLLSEYHLRPGVEMAVTESHISEEMRRLAKSLEAAQAAHDDLASILTASSIPSSGGGQTSTIGEVFDIIGGNSGLTEELIYENWPIDENDAVNVLSGATDDSTSMGVVSSRARPGGRTLKTFSGPALVAARKGKAGTIQLIPQGKWAINDDAYVLLPSKKWKNRVILEWARTQLEPQLRRITTSNSDNATLSKEYMSSAALYIPPINYQKYVGALSSSMLEQAKVLASAAVGLEDLGRSPIATSDSSCLEPG
ncbi:N-6 DNA methylase [Mycobacteroides abscessus subsp. massiliense]|uniref:N-6 DNA methylase n=1 Tax=Mycobacteroides abscessus TaxID=36809 RepID=UPI0009CB1194|nr:N-6 DNA methylase [Mycobacteroides abscessus]SKD28394.1 N-6 DNA methylase [Mycobacteroides abscessus subsp. massiliense]SKF39231.1 N-6 DNA methylase [Mycobacteroides abscessus subsp. massiliense]SKK00982.1 N-6 DNA methylase [Mycobacteroides abscessus subsp. massiliense]SKK75642.1 N-6 DNA methylase [Mycobacteroides abscessus subsp. massiliense]SKM73725.1 N-6 DNA methylase [Mycobacteroides abscessus subsp. massiliense]